jgi:hypothetical protein
MPAQAAGLAERDRQRSRRPDPALHSHRGEIVAAAAAAAVAGQLVLAPVTLALTVVLTLTGRCARWRPHWLALPALTGLTLLASGRGAALDGFLAPARALAAGLSAGIGPSRIAHRIWIAASAPGQLPLAVLASTAEAGILLWACLYRRDSRPASGWRPGAIALVRGRVRRAALADGRTVTRGGCALGIDPGTGSRATVTWSDFEAGVLACSADPAAAIGQCLPAVAAALRRRMAVVILDLTPGSELTQAVISLGRALGVGVRRIADVHAVELGRKILGRECAIAPAASADVAALEACLRGLADIGIRGDALVWVHGIEEAQTEVAAGLVPLGSPVGVRILLSTCCDAAGMGLRAAVGTTLVAQRDGTCSLVPGRPWPGRAEVRYAVVPLRAVTACR